MGVIIIKYGKRKELEKLFNTSHVTVRRALNDKSKSDLAKRIRKAALERGGAEVSEQSKK